MIRSVKIALGAAVLAAIAGSAYAADPQQGSPATGQQLGYTPPAPAPAPQLDPNQGNPEHFVKPPGYDQDRRNYPYGPGYGPKPS